MVKDQSKAGLLPAIDSPLFKYAPVFLEICFFIHLCFSLVGWNNQLNDFHEFRQCQTAISAYYTVQDGFRLDYETPVLGKPWSIPMEFPLFQWVVAAAVMAFHTPLDQTGRFFSLLFFYLTLFPLYSLLRFFTPDRNQRLFLLGLLLLNPIYLFWPRTFMIESLALLLGTLYLWMSAKALESKGFEKKYYFMASLLGAMAGSVKITTWAVFWPPCALLALVLLPGLKTSRDFLSIGVRQYFPRAFFLGILPLAASLTWVRYTDHLKNLNPLAAHFLTASSLFSWNFGTLEQKLHPFTWYFLSFNSRTFNLLGDIPWLPVPIPALALVAAVTLWIFPRGRNLRLACLAFFFSPLLVFTNLYFIHDYYFFANNLFLVFFIGLTLLAILGSGQNKLWPRAAMTLFTVLFLYASFSKYLATYEIFKKRNPLGISIAQTIRDHTRKDDVLLIYDFLWSPAIPYYSERRALMDPGGASKGGKMLLAFDQLKGEKIGALLMSRKRSQAFIQEQVQLFDLNPIPLVNPEHFLFLAKWNVPSPVNTPKTAR